MSNANQSDFRARWDQRARRKQRLAKMRYEQVRERDVFGKSAPALRLPTPR